ncbi:hypothetical protein H8K47_14720 [Undibacterium sp. CY7W]|uniref:Uncharacterized protein n=1 Tax=Undibacterium rugosum TaxID=2762291 RepID=A0A923KZS8_9BURK|nr:hypothetical protein [Undibacterium rugosum]MBC3936618.1 hypothetical protein [Undibacterium rugosum]
MFVLHHPQPVRPRKEVATLQVQQQQKTRVPQTLVAREPADDKAAAPRSLKSAKAK